MNGEVNGPMEEPSDAPVEGPETAHSDIITTSKDCNVEVYKCDTTVAELPESNHISEAGDDLESNEAKCLVNGIGNEVEDVVCEEERDPLVDLDQKLHVSEISIPSEDHNKDSVNVNEQSDLQTSPENGIGLEKVVETSGIDSAENDHQAPQSEPMESDGAQSVEESSDESVVSSGLRQDDAVSIHSDSGADGGDDTSQESPTKLKTSELVTVEKEKRPNSQNGDTCGSPSPEVDAPVIVIKDSPDKQRLAKPSKPPKVVPEIKPPLRRSSRAIKRKRYDDGATNGDDDSDNDDVSEPHRRRSRPIVINDTKCLVEMATRQMKSNQAGHYKKEPTVVIIDTNSSLSVRMPQAHKHQNKMVNASSGSVSAESLYQSIVARGTTVTPVPAKANVATQSASPQPLILPTLTDDMFVVEVPSFIVPYIYEKPSVKPFREFVDVLGNELAEQRAKEEKEEQEKLEKEKKEKIERGELMEDSEVESGQKEQEKEDDKDKMTSDKEADKEKAKTGTEVEQTDDGKKKLKAEKRDSRKRNDDDDDMSWDGEFSADSDDEVGSDEEAKTVVIKDKLEAVTDLKGVTDLTVEKVVTGKSDNYFDCSLGKFFMNIGLNLVQEYVQNDLLKQQNRKLHKETRTGQNTKQTETSIACLRKNLEFSQENNAPYKFPKKKCEQCAFKTESSLVLAHHMETPHMRNNMYKCSYCPYEVRSPHDMLFHMDAQHQVRGRLERPQSYHQCANCTFEDNGKGKLARHLLACAKKFKPDSNLSPPVEWEPPAKIPKQMPRSRNHPMGTYQGSFQRAGQFGAGVARSSVVNTMIQGSGYRPRARLPMGVPARAAVQGAPILRGGTMLRHGGAGVLNNYSIGNNVKNINSNKSSNQPSISITPLPRQPAPPTPVHIHNATKNSCVICEICDGYIKDLEQLRNHMQWIHKVKIHPKMIYNRPPLNCQKCQFRFFTDQGLERHLLGSHGLITSSMQEAAYKGKDAGRCPVCGRIYQWKLLNHVSRDHSLTLKPAHLSYKCTVCTATFGMYKQFESHVYSAHSVVAKRAMDKSRSAPTKQGEPLKPIKINDEITITPQPTATATADDGAVEEDK